MSIARFSHQLYWVARSAIFQRDGSTKALTSLRTIIRPIVSRVVILALETLRAIRGVPPTVLAVATGILTAILAIDPVSMTGVWRAANLLTKSWQDGVVVYNLDSGNTHLLNPIAGQVLKLLADGPADAATIARQLACQIELESDAELDYSVASLLNHLDSLGLIEPIPA